MNQPKQSPIEQLNPHEKWYRFNSLPYETQESIVKLLKIARGDGLGSIIIRAKLHKLYSLTDAEIIASCEKLLVNRFAFCRLRSTVE